MAGIAEVFITLRTTEEGGRQTPLHLGEDFSPHYRPHVVVHDGDGEYLGVEFIDGPDRPVNPGDSTYTTIRFMYEDRGLSYDALVVHATFDVREGGRTIAVGRVTRR
jgi:translation elongation factor EF-Tu-like GTPase